MITENQLRVLDFEFDIVMEQWQYKDIILEFVGLYSEMVVKLQDFQVFGIQDHRDLSKFIKLVYGE
jgi:hypothetical protein